MKYFLWIYLIAKTREIIFGIHLAKREQNPDDFNIKSLAENSVGFSGSEIEQAVVSSLYSALAQKNIIKRITFT